MLQFSNKAKKEEGFTLLELILVVAGISILAPMLFSFANMAANRISEKAVAGHLVRVSEAVKEYILANYDTLRATATDTVATTIPFAALITDGHLPVNYQFKNGWGQTYQIYVLESHVSNLQVVILTTGGRDQSISSRGFADRMVPNAALNAGANFGYIPTGNIPGESNAVLMGTLGGWSFTFAGTNVPNPGAGHLGAMMYFDSTDINANDYLHRVRVPGKPEFNTMTVDLDMDGNTITMGGGDVGGGDTEGVGRVNFEDLASGAYACAAGDDSAGSLYFNDAEGLFLCRQGQLHRINDTGNTGSFQSAGIVANGTIITKPSCPARLPNPGVFFAPTMMSEDNSVRPLQAVQAWAVDNGNGTWTSNLRVMANGDWAIPSPLYGRTLAMITCRP